MKFLIQLNPQQGRFFNIIPTYDSFAGPYFERLAEVHAVNVKQARIQAAKGLFSYRPAWAEGLFPGRDLALVLYPGEIEVNVLCCAAGVTNPSAEICNRPATCWSTTQSLPLRCDLHCAHHSRGWCRPLRDEDYEVNLV